MNEKKNKGGRPPKTIKPIPTTPEKLGGMVMQTLPKTQWKDVSPLAKQADDGK